MLRASRCTATIGLVKPKRALSRIVADESLDLYVLAATAFVFTILGVTGVSSLTDLASMILALLAVLALSQIRSRHHVAAIAAAQHADPFSVLATEFPSDLIALRGAASDLLLIGTTMSRTVQGSSGEDMRRMLTRGGQIRALLLDPTNEALIRTVSARNSVGLTPDRLKARINATLDELISLRDRTGGQLEIRVASSPPAMGMNVIDPYAPNGALVVQHKGYKPIGESAPIMRFKREDGFWFSHFLDEAERIWEDGNSWPLSPAQALERSPRPIFLEAFGTELEQGMGRASTLLITGISRNTLLTSNYNKFEAWLRAGCRIRFLLIDPSAGTTISQAADRYYAERSPSFLRERIKHSLSLLDELRRSTGGTLEIRLASYPLAMGIIAVDSTADLRSASSAIFAEYYTYQAAGEPKFVLTPADAQWYENMLGEAEAFWSIAADYPDATRPDTL
jgi:Domain of unknown function (DUF5919)